MLPSLEYCSISAMFCCVSMSSCLPMSVLIRLTCSYRVLACRSLRPVTPVVPDVVLALVALAVHIAAPAEDCQTMASKMWYFGFASPKFSHRIAVGHDELNEANVPPVVLAEDLRQLQPSGTRRLVVPGQLRAATPPPPQKTVVTSDHALEY